MNTTKRPRRPAGSRNDPRTADVSGAFESGTSVVEELKDEMSEWADNMESNSMEHLPKFEEVSEARDALEAALDNLQGIECPDFLGEIEVTYTQDTRQSANSRAGRLDNARQELDAALAGAQQWLDEHEELEQNDPEDEEEGDADADAVTEDEVIERQEQREAAEEFVNELEGAISELDSVSFPGMY